MSRGRFIALSVLLDGILVNAAIVGAFFLRFGGELPEFNFSAYAALWPLITVLYLAGGYVYGLYEPERTEGTWGVVRAVAQAVTLGTVLTAAIAFFAGPRFFSFSRLVIVIAYALQFVTLVGWRLAALRLTPITWPEQRVLIVGVNAEAIELARELADRAEWGHRLVGFVRRDAGEHAAGELTAPVLGVADGIADIVRAQNADRIIIASPVALRELVEDIALANELDVTIEVVPELYEIFIGTVDSTVSDIPLMQLTRPATPGWFTVTKRVLDFFWALALLLVLSPVLLVVSAAVLVSMGWPVFFVQERVGRGMEPFSLIKFRTMVRDAEKHTGPVLATENDTRITGLGQFLRRYRLDELPQLVNILLGQMSFVGPRPERRFFVDRYLEDIPGYRERFAVKPGVTGLAQVSGSYATTAERKLKYDLIYMYHQSLLMDAQILVETLRVVLTGRGAR